MWMRSQLWRLTLAGLVIGLAGPTIPDGTAAAVALLEHRWAIPLRDKIARAGGVTLSDAWVHAADLVAIGLVGAAAKDAAGVDA